MTFGERDNARYKRGNAIESLSLFHERKKIILYAKKSPNIMTVHYCLPTKVKYGRKSSLPIGIFTPYQKNLPSFPKYLTHVLTSMMDGSFVWSISQKKLLLADTDTFDFFNQNNGLLTHGLFDYFVIVGNIISVHRIVKWNTVSVGLKQL